jgi:uncharacterized protein YjeT (DUF2065 family)
MDDLIAVAGLVLILEGMVYFVAPGTMKRLLARIPALPERTLRTWGAAAISLGLLLAYLGRR